MNIDLTKVNNLSDLVQAIQGLDKILVLGNSPHIDELDFGLVDQCLTIGVNKIGYKYNPDILMWSEVFQKLGNQAKEADQEYMDLLVATNAKVKIARGWHKTFKTPGCLVYPKVKDFGHDFEGGLHWGAGIFGAIHLAMVAKPKEIYIAGVDYHQNKYFYDDKETAYDSEKLEFYGTEGFRGEFERTILPRFADILEVCQVPIYMCSVVSRVPGYPKSDRFNRKTN